MRFNVIFATVKPDISDRVIDAAKNAGATGATIIPSRGTGVREAKTFFGLTLEAQTDIILFLVEEHITKEVLNVIGSSGKFHKPGTGIAFVLPVENVIGLESQMASFKEKVRDQYF